MANLFGTGINQVPTNGMLGNLAFQDKAYLSVDKIGIGTTAVDTGTANQSLQNYGGAYISGSTGIGTTNPQATLDVVGNVRISGVATFQSDVKLGDNNKIVLGDGNDLQIYHDGSNSIVGDFGTGYLVLASNGGQGVTIEKTPFEPIAYFNVDGAVELYHNGIKEFETTGYGATVFGELRSQSLNISGISTLSNTRVNGTLGIGSQSPTSSLDVVGGVKVLGVVTASAFVGVFSGSIYYSEFSGISSTLASTSSVNTTGIITASRFSTGATGTGINITTNTISGPSTLILDPAGVGDDTGAVRIRGDLFVDGTQTYINSTTIELADFNVGIATTVGTNALLDGAGIGIGSTNIRKTLTWNNTSGSLRSSENIDVVSGKSYKINGNNVLDATTLGTGVVNSSLTSLGTLVGLNISGIATLSVNSSSDALRITQLGAGNALLVEDSANPDATPFVVNASGSVGLGTNAPAYSLHIRDNLSTSGGIFVESNSTAFTSPIIRVRGVRGDSNTSQSFSGQLVLEKYQTSGATTSGRNLGAIIFGGNFDTAPGITTGITYGASIGAMADGTFADVNTAPTAIVFNTGTVGLGTLGLANVTYGTEAARITSNRNLLIGTTSETGTASQRLQVIGGAYVSASVGIAVTNPSATLDVGGTTDGNIQTIFTRGADPLFRLSAINATASNANGALVSKFGLVYGTSGDSAVLKFYRGAGAYDASIAIDTQQIERFRITGTGNIGIGISTPTALLQVQGNTLISGITTINNGLVVNGNTLYVDAPNNRVGILTTSPSQTVQIGSGSNVVVVDSTGEIGIGTTNPLQKLHVLGNLLVAAGSSTAQHITQRAYELNNGTLSWEGSAGQLFSITNNLTSGSIFSVNDVSGIPSIDVNADGTVTIAPYGVNERVGIGTTNPTAKLDVVGNARFVGIVTATTFSGSFSGNATTASTATYAINAGVATYASSAGVATYAPLAGVSTNVSGGTASVTSLNVTGISTISVNSSFNALRITQTGTGNALVVEDSTNPDADPFVIDQSGNVGIGTIIPSAILDIRGNPWFSPNLTGAKATALRLGRFVDGVNAAFDIITNDSAGDDLEIQSNRFTGNLRVSRASPVGVQTTFILATHFQTGTSISIADTTGTTTKIRLDEAADTYFNNSGPVLVGTISSTGTSNQKLQVTGGGYISGDLGVGVVSPLAKLDVAGTVRVSSGATFNGDVTLSAVSLTQGNGNATFNQTTSSFVVGSQTSGVLTLGGTNQTGTITVGLSTVSHTLNIATGISSTTAVKTINIGTGGLSGSQTLINVGPVAGVGTISINSGTTIGIGTTLPTRAVDILSGVRLRGPLYDKDNDIGFSGQVLVSTGSAVDWVTASSAIGGLVGVNIQDEGVGVGTTVPTLNFTGNGIQATSALNTATININATNNNTASTIVFRDASGNFSAGTITANLIGNASSSNTSGYATTAGISTNVTGAAQRILYNSTTDTTTTSANLTYNGATLTHSGTFNQNGTMNVYQINLPQNPNNVGFGTTIANPAYYIGQTMGDSDYWKIYGESPAGANTGTLVFEVQDDIDNSERFAFRTRRTYSSPGFTTALLLDTSQAVFSGAITGTNLTLTNATNALISGPATITIDPAAVGNETGIVRIRGDLYVDGTQTTINSGVIDLADLNVGIATTVGTDVLLDGGGIGIGSTNIRKTIQWNNATSSLRSSENWDLASGKIYRIAGTNVLSANTLGAGVVNSSLTSVGTLSSLNVTGTVSVGSNIEFTNTNTQRGIFGTTGTNDYWFVGGAATGASAGYLEIATGDDASEPIYVRQYTGSPLSGTVSRTLTLLDGAGDTTLPGSLTVNGGFSLNSDLTVNGYVYRGAAIKTASLFIRGTGLNAAANRFVYLNGTQIVNTNTRGLTLTLIGAGLTHISSTNYDTFGDPAQSNNLATAIGIVTTGQIAVLTSYDAWENQITANLRAAALKAGLTKLATYNAGGSRRPYAAVFYGSGDYPNAAPHDVIERMESDDAEAPRATIFCNIATEGSSIGINGAYSTNALFSAQSTTEDPAVYVDSNNNTTVSGILTATSGFYMGSNQVVNSSGNIYFDGTPTVVNQNRGIYWTAYDKETVTDFSDAAHIRHTVASGGLTGSVIEIRSDNDVTDGVNIIVASSADGARINGNAIWHAGNDGAGTGLDADTVDGYNTSLSSTANTIVVRNGSGDIIVGVITCTDVNSTSDIRLKTSIHQIDNPLEKVLSIRGVSFEWRENHKQSAGVIAQEVEKVLPELVSDGDKYKSVNYNGLIGVLIEAIKEQQKQIDELKRKIG